MNSTALIFPHQLFEDQPLIEKADTVFLIEEHLFFNQYKFHKQKLIFHRATMQMYQRHLKNGHDDVRYINATDKLSDIRLLLDEIRNEFGKVIINDPVDNWLQHRIESKCEALNISLEILASPGFINTRDDLQSFFKASKKKFYQTSFYKSERKRLNILLEANDQPAGGKWTYDSENRKSYPKDKTPPEIVFPHCNEIINDAIVYVKANWKDNPGEWPSGTFYPINFEDSKAWLKQFLSNRFKEFGPYEDAIVKEENYLNHSILSPLINSGLLTPKYVIDNILEYIEENEVPLNSTEGLIRQIIGWREFIRGVYMVKGSFERTHNYWNFSRKIPVSFYEGTTGIGPLDDTIKKVLATGYCHHIERLMVLGNFMLLCEFDPEEVYKWFMELFIDAYDWVMVPNVYGMSQFADGGLMSTKPYISSSNYIKKMSNYGTGEWDKVWDGLFWRFMHVHRGKLEANPRLSMLLSTLDRMNEQTINGHMESAQKFIDQL